MRLPLPRPVFLLFLLLSVLLSSICQAFLLHQNRFVRHRCPAKTSCININERYNIQRCQFAAETVSSSTSLDFPEWKQDNYLRIHQRTNKRRAIKRFLNILSVMSGRVLRPLVCNLVEDPVWMEPDKTWDDFWVHKRGKWTNAERVALGLPSLGPTFMKLGQAAATRPDILNVPLAEALNRLQYSVATFDDLTAKRIVRRDLQGALRTTAQRTDNIHKKHSRGLPHIKDENALQAFMGSLSEKPVAAASIAQVYKGNLPGFGPVAVKVQRPGIRKKVERDATLFHTVAEWFERQKWPSGTPFQGEPLFGTTQFVRTVDEFTARVFEDMDFEREVQNMQVFGRLYDPRQGSKVSKNVQLVVPKVIPELCSRRVIVMEWIEGTKLTDIDEAASGDTNTSSQKEKDENLALVKKAIECTLSQMLDTGVVHADPHTGNLLKIREKNGNAKLGYIDFGLVNQIPQRFRDGITNAVVQVVFARNIQAVADLCVDVGLLSEETMNMPSERKKFLDALNRAFDSILVWPKDERGRHTTLPKVRFQNLLASLAIMIASFEFTVPPYFLNNARALATLEGIALKIDPSFNILKVIYPYSINHLMKNSKISSTAQESFLDICRDPDTKLVDWNRFMMLLNDWAMFTGQTKLRIFWDLATSTGGRRVSSRIFREFFLKRYRRLKSYISTRREKYHNNGLFRQRLLWSQIPQHQQQS